MVRCTCTTTKGTQCTRNAVKGKYCSQHITCKKDFQIDTQKAHSMPKSHLWDRSPGMMIEPGQSHFDYKSWDKFIESSIWKSNGFEMEVTWVWVNSKGITWKDFKRDKMNEVTMVWLRHAPLMVYSVKVDVKDSDESRIRKFLLEYGFISK